MTSLHTPQSTDSQFDPAPSGWQIARCFTVIDLGTHINEKFQKETHYVRIGFELPKTKRNDGRPFAIYSRYTLSHHDKSRLRQDLEAWYSKKFSTAALNKAGGFDLAKIIDRPAFLNITHNETDSGEVYANIAVIGPIPAEMECPAMINKPVVFSLQEFDQAVFDGLTDKTKEFIQQSGEYKVMTGQLKAPRGYKGPQSGQDYQVGRDYQPDGTFEDMMDDIPI